MGRGGEGGVKASTAADDLVPVTLLCGFLGSGKTTLLKHILENQHDDKNFRAAVIVNDMAELNIDEKLIDKKSLIQSDEAMIGMQNGCICCTLQSDLVEQLIALTQMKNEDEKMKFNYILIEASGVSEPHEIAPLFEIEDHDACGIDDAPDHDHDHDHGSGLQLGQVARLDTCVTLIDSAEFYNNLGSMKTYDQVQSDMVGTIPELMMDQVEFANVIILNKGDLVNDKQKADLDEKIALLNPQAKVIKTTQAKVDVMNLLHTKLYKDKEEFFVTSTKTTDYVENERKRLEAMGERVPEACTARFDIKSFVYRARKPFHPGRLEELFLEPYFMDPEPCLDPAMEGVEIDPASIDPEEYKTEEEKKKEFEEIQRLAIGKQKKRIEVMGELLRSKGFFWNAPTHDVIGGWQQAGNVLRLEAESPWMCLMPDFWEGTKFEPAVRRDMTKPGTSEVFEYEDRRQEIVFIGHRMKEAVIQEILDKCLLTDEEYAMGPDMWKETMEELDTIQLELPDMVGDEDDDGVENMIVVGDDEKEHASEECRRACEGPRDKTAMGEAGLKYFKVAISALFKNWTALQMLVGTGAGGPQSKEKAEWMTGATENWFYENKDLEVYEVSVFLDEILINEFNVSVDDGSLEDVARSICEFFRLCQFSDEETLMSKLKSLPKYDLANVQIQEYNYVDQSGPSNYLQKLDMLEPKKEPKVQKEKIAPEIDEEGFETVKSRKKRR